jgi:hypothetical protein
MVAVPAVGVAENLRVKKYKREEEMDGTHTHTHTHTHMSREIYI